MRDAVSLVRGFVGLSERSWYLTGLVLHYVFGHGGTQSLRSSVFLGCSVVTRPAPGAGTKVRFPTG